MTLDLDTFPVTLYTIVDDLYWAHYAHLKPQRPGKHPELSDSEVLTQEREIASSLPGGGPLAMTV